MADDIQITPQITIEVDSGKAKKQIAEVSEGVANLAKNVEGLKTNFYSSAKGLNSVLATLGKLSSASGKLEKDLKSLKKQSNEILKLKEQATKSLVERQTSATNRNKAAEKKLNAQTDDINARKAERHELHGVTMELQKSKTVLNQFTTGLTKAQRNLAEAQTAYVNVIKAEKEELLRLNYPQIKANMLNNQSELMKYRVSDEYRALQQQRSKNESSIADSRNITANAYDRAQDWNNNPERIALVRQNYETQDRNSRTRGRHQHFLEDQEEFRRSIGWYESIVQQRKTAGLMSKNNIISKSFGLMSQSMVKANIPILSNLMGGAFKTVGTMVKNPILGVVAAVSQAVTGILKLGSTAIQASIQMESLKTSLGVVMGTKAETNSMFKDISAYAVKSPFGVAQTTELATLLKQSGVRVTDLMTTLKMLGDTAGGSSEKLKRIANNYAQIMSTGKASMLDMRQFAYAGIPIFKEVAKELNVSQTRLRSLVSDGKVSGEVIEKVFKRLTSEGGLFANATEKGAKTLKARIQNLKDASSLALASIGDNILGIGTDASGESFASRSLGVLENIATSIGNIAQTANVKKAVKDEKKNENEIIRIEKQISQLENLKKNTSPENKTLTEAFNSQIEELKKEILSLSNVYSDDVKRAIFNDSYHVKADGWNSLPDNIKNMSYKENVAKREEIRKTINELGTEKIVQGYRIKEYSQEELLKKGALENSLETLIKSLDYNSSRLTVTAEEIKAFNQTEFLKAQQSAIDFMDRLASRSGSYLNESDVVMRKWETETDEGRKEAEKREEELIDRVQTMAEELKKVTDSNGSTLNVQDEDFKIEDFLKWIEAGAFRIDDRYSDVYAEDLTKDQAKEMQADVNEYLDKAVKYLLGLGSGHLYNLGIALKQKLAPKTNVHAASKITPLNSVTEDLDKQKFFEDFNALGSDILEVVNYYLGSNNVSSDDAKIIRNLFGANGQLAPFFAGTLETDTSAAGKNFDKSEKKQAPVKKEEYIPLWRRILSESFGVDVQAITSTKDAIEAFSQNLMLRDTVGNVSRAAFADKTMTIRDYQKILAKTRGAGQVDRGKSDDKVYQVDWVKATESLKKFVRNLKYSTSAVEAWGEDLKSQQEIFEKLLTSDILKEENVKVSKLSAYADLKNLKNGEVAVNAFGEHLKYKDSEGVIQEAEYKGNGKYTKKGSDTALTGKELESVYLEGTVFESTTKILEQIYKEQQEQTKQLIENNDRATFADKSLDTFLENNIMSHYSPEEVMGRAIDGGKVAVISRSRIKNEKKISPQQETNSFLINTDEKGEVTGDTLKEFLTIVPAGKNESTDNTKQNNNNLNIDENSISVAIAQAIAQSIPHSATLENEFIQLIQPALSLTREAANPNPMYIEELGFYKEDMDLIKRYDEVVEDGFDKRFEQALTDSFTKEDSPFANKEEFYAAFNSSNEHERYGARELAENLQFEVLKEILEFMKSAGGTAYIEQLEKQKNLSEERELWGGITNRQTDNGAFSKGDDGELEAHPYEYFWNTRDKNTAIQQEKLESAGMGDLQWDDLSGDQKSKINVENTTKSLEKLLGTIKDLTKVSLEKTLVSPFVEIGKQIRLNIEGVNDWDHYLANVGKSLMDILGSMMQQIGPAMTTAGFQLIGSGNWAVGAALVAAGGIVTGLGMINDKKTEAQKEERDLDRAQDLKDQLADLLEQARKDSLYYENNLRHKTALGINKKFSLTEVNDAIITPSGNVVSTHPDDYLIATKTPGSLVNNGGAPSVNNNITFKVVNNAGDNVKVRQEKQQNGDDTEFIAIIENIAGSYISSDRSDEAFGIRNARTNGSSTVM